MKSKKLTELIAFVRKNALPLLLAAACATVLLFVGSSLQSEEPQPVQEVPSDDSTYISDTEKKLKQILENTKGVGKCEVMLTLQSGTEYIYAQEQISGSHGVDNTYKIITDGKTESPVIIKKRTPQIAGVAIVCDGGDSSQIKNTITDIVCKMLAIDGAQVSVNKRK